MTKAQTLKAAIMYIEHMEKLLSSSPTSIHINKNSKILNSSTCNDNEENKYCCSLPSVSNQQSYDFMSNSNSPLNDEYCSPNGAVSIRSASDSELYLSNKNHLDSYCINPNNESKLESFSCNDITQSTSYDNFNLLNNKTSYQDNQLHLSTNVSPKSNFTSYYPLTSQSSNLNNNNIDYRYSESNIYQYQLPQQMSPYYCENSNQYIFMPRNYHSV